MSGAFANIFNPTPNTLQAGGFGLTLPVLTTAQRLTLAAPDRQPGITVFDSTLNQLFYWNGSAWVSLTAGASGNDIQSFAVGGPFTWTKPTGTPKWVRVFMVSAGSGGSSGGVQAAGVAAAGGAGGGGGCSVFAEYPAASLGVTEPVQVGIGGTGGASVNTNNTAGNNAPDFATTGASIFSTGANRLFCNPGGNASSAAPQTGRSATTRYATGVGFNPGLAGGSENSTPSSTSFAPGAGGGGGNVSAGNVAADGGFGATGAFNATITAQAGGQRGTAPGGNGAVGDSLLASTQCVYPCGGSGGGGGAGSTVGNGGAGGTGGWPGGGGGGGGGTRNGFASGAGGNGADGLVVIVTLY